MTTASEILFFSSLLFIWFIFSLLLRSLTKLRKKTFQQYPPSPPKLPIIGHLHLLSSVQTKSFQALATRYGPIMKLNLGASTLILVSNSTIAKEMLKTNELNFACRPDFGSPDFDIYKGFNFFTAEYGTYWRFMKKICMTQLLSSPQVNRFVDIRKQEMMKLLEIIVKCSEGGTECDLGHELMTMTNNMTCRMAMSTRCSKNGDENREIWAFVKGIMDIFPKFLFGEMLGPLGKFDLFGHGKKLKGLLMQFDRLVDGIMMEHEERDVNHKSDHEREREDMMDILLKLYRDETAEVKLTKKHIKCFFMEIFVAGTETTSVALQWTIAELINHPDVFKKLREEINSVVGSTRLVNESDVPNLPYLQAVVKESLRLHPSGPLIPRKCIEDCKINGYDILANDRIMINLYAIMRDPDLWEDPTAFVPDRFLVNLIDGHDDGTDQQQHHHLDVKGSNNFEYFPFGSGRRGCPGATLAWLVMQSVVAVLVQCFDFKVNGGKKIDMDEGSGFSAGMAHPLVCYPIIHFNPPEINMVAK